MAPDDIINENDGEQEEEQEEEQVENIIDLNNYGMKPYSWRYEGEGGGGGGGEGGGGYLKVSLDTDTMTLDKTWQEIHDAIGNGWYCSIVAPAEDEGVEGYNQIQLDSVQASEGEYSVFNTSQSIGFMTDSADGYPIFIS